MLTCIACSKQPSEDSSSDVPPTKQTINMLSSQIKDMALKASGAYRNCAPCVNHERRRDGDGETGSVAADKFRWSYRRTGSSSSNSAGRRELLARLKGITSGEGMPASASGRRVDPVVFVEESEPKEWVAQVEPGVLITFMSLPCGGNDLKQIKFSREMFNKGGAQRWWAENCEKVMELYNVQRLNRQTFPLPSTPRSEDDVTATTKMESIKASPITPPLGREPSPRTGMGVGYFSTETLDHHSMHSSGAKMETSSLDASMRTNSSISSVGYLETEWVEEDEPGVYLTIRALPHGRRELRRVRFSREKYGEIHARVWWEENRDRIHKQYL
ncbi:hypothetical protein ACS0TY_021409 [Phlomoides rotata]